MAYESDWALVGAQAAGAGAAGAVFGGAVGMSRLRSAPRYAVAGALQMGLMAGSFVVLREGYRHLLHVDAWHDDWYAINTISAGTGAALFGAMRMGYSRHVFIRSFTAGSIAGLALSVGYMLSNSVMREALLRSRGLKPEPSPSPSFMTLPSWFPFRKLTDEEMQKINKEKQ